ncbi:MAG: hypothetical protein ACXWYM_00385 [Candidatus Binatia bacterium]
MSLNKERNSFVMDERDQVEQDELLNSIFGEKEFIDVPLNDGAGRFFDDLPSEDDEDKEPGDDIDGGDHDENLASLLEDSALYLIADDIIKKTEADIESRSQWNDRLRTGMEIMGIVSVTDDKLPFSGAAAAVHPLIAESVVQFNARAQAELLPPTGPCKGYIIGDETDEAREQADRMERHMNYQMTEEDEGYFDELDTMLFYLPLAGSAFTKTYFDNNLYTTTTRFVKAEQMAVPYTARSMRNAGRYAFIDSVSRDEMKRRMKAGLYRDVDLSDPDMNTFHAESEEVRGAYDEIDGREVVMDDDDAEHTVYESYINYVIPGFEDKDDNGEETGVADPYIITIDKDNRTVLSIRRNWDEKDPLRRPLDYFSHYRFLPGYGIFGVGLIHIIGGLAEACTGSMRALLDSAAFATMQGGFKAKDATMPAGDIILSPGVYHDVDMSADELANAFYTPPFKEPSAALFQMLQLLEENGRRMAGTTDSVVGDSKNTGPVGTTVALIEQGTKVMTGVHRRLHRSQRKEFRIRARINARNLPDHDYYYDSRAGNSFIRKDDYTNDMVDVTPVSDPNIVSATQRIAKQQAVLQLAENAPDLYRRYAVHWRMLDALGVDEIDAILKDPDMKIRCDAAGEGARLMDGQRVWAFPDQNHDHHLAVHGVQMQYLKTLPPEQVQPLFLALQEHISKHEAYRFHAFQSQALGQQLPPPDLYSDNSEENEMDAQTEMLVTASAAQNIGGLIAHLQQVMPPDPAQQEIDMKLQAKQAEHQQKEQQKQEAFMSDEQRKQAQFERDQDRRDADTVSRVAQSMNDGKIKQDRKDNAPKAPSQ